LIYLIWTFQPIEDSALGDIDSYTARWFEDHEFPGHEKNAPEAQKALVKSSVSTFAKLAHQAGEAFGDGIASAKRSLSHKLS
jgi:hypothetical protein